MACKPWLGPFGLRECFALLNISLCVLRLTEGWCLLQAVMQVCSKGPNRECLFSRGLLASQSKAAITRWWTGIFKAKTKSLTNTWWGALLSFRLQTSIKWEPMVFVIMSDNTHLPFICISWFWQTAIFRGEWPWIILQFHFVLKFCDVEHNL